MTYDIEHRLNMCYYVDVSPHLPFFCVSFQDLVISERLTVRFAHAAQMIKMGPGTAGSSPTSSPGTSRKSRIEVRTKGWSMAGQHTPLTYPPLLRQNFNLASRGSPMKRNPGSQKKWDAPACRWRVLTAFAGRLGRSGDGTPILEDCVKWECLRWGWLNFKPMTHPTRN